MPNRAETYQNIADILSFKLSATVLEAQLSVTNFNWDAIVKVGSQHLVLPAIYCQLKSKHLLHCLPDDLKHYLNEITTINRNRNKAIIKQVQWVSNIFNSNHIEHVFLKGAAILASGLYEDIAERMIGDIDVLVALPQLDKAYSLLLDHNFSEGPKALGDPFFEHKHLPRLLSNDHICAVEIHRKLSSNFKDPFLSNTTLLDKKRIINSIAIPSYLQMVKHHIYNYQFEDKGYIYNTINFRSVYEMMNLLHQNTVNLPWHKDKKIRSYFDLASQFVIDFEGVFSEYLPIKTKLFHVKLKHTRLHTLWIKLVKLHVFFSLCINRLQYLFTNKNYRNAIFSQRRRIFKDFITIVNKRTPE